MSESSDSVFVRLLKTYLEEFRHAEPGSVERADCMDRMTKLLKAHYKGQAVPLDARVGKD